MMSTNLFDLTGESALIIGGTGVLGGAIARALGEAGSLVIVSGRNQERGEAQARSLQEAGIRASFEAADACDKTSLLALQERLLNLGITPGILVNAAGGNTPAATVTPDHPLDQITTQAWLENYELNFLGGVLLPCQIFGAAMIKAGGGSIINIASVSAHIPLSRVAAYASAKAAVLNFTQFLAREWAPFGVRVNSITPGFFPAEQNRRLLFNEDGSPTPRAQSILNHTPMNRFGEPHELGGAAVFLASRKASGFVTGTDIRVDGGFLAQTI